MNTRVGPSSRVILETMQAELRDLVEIGMGDHAGWPTAA